MNEQEERERAEDINLGDVARERMTLQPQELKDGKPIEIHSFDRPQLELVRRRAARGTSHTGGPRAEPERGR